MLVELKICMSVTLPNRLQTIARKFRKVYKPAVRISILYFWNCFLYFNKAEAPKTKDPRLKRAISNGSGKKSTRYSLRKTALKIAVKK